MNIFFGWGKQAESFYGRDRRIKKYPLWPAAGQNFCWVLFTFFRARDSGVTPASKTACDSGVTPAYFLRSTPA